MTERTGPVDNGRSLSSFANGDENQSFGGSGARYVGNFHKTMPHNEFGEVAPEDYRKFVEICDDLESGKTTDFETMVRKFTTPPHQAPLFGNVVQPYVSPLINPAAGAAKEQLGPDPKDLNMGPAPKVAGKSTAAEMVELYWMAMLRDLPFSRFDDDALLAKAIKEIRARFLDATSDATDAGRLRLGLDLPQRAGALDISPRTVFRSGLPDEENGPLVSQFFLHDAAFGTHRIFQSQIPYRQGRNYLTDHGTWLLAENTGYDRHGRHYPNANHYSDDNAYYETDLKRRRMRTMRDLARFVNRDALHQAYFDAALMLIAWNAPTDKGNPYGHGRTRDIGFGTLGPPHLLTLVSEVASRALKVVWRQKWLVHRRLRPEAYGGLAQMQFQGLGGNRRDYGLPAWLQGTEAVKQVEARYGKLFLPMAYSSGSPAHPSYGAGHATVAGACVTVLKAWFDDKMRFAHLFDRKMSGGPLEPGGDVDAIVMPDEQGSQFLPEYTGADAMDMTLGGELNKLASNVAMGRSMGGVHWRSDNTRSLRLGEVVALEIMRRQSGDYAEAGMSFTFTSFDGAEMVIKDGQVTRDGKAITVLPAVVADVD